VREKITIGLALITLTLAAGTLLLVGCGPAASANANLGISPGAVQVMQGVGIKHTEGLSPTVVYTATFYVQPQAPGQGVWTDSLDEARQIHVDGELIVEHLQGTVYPLPWEESEEGALIVDEVLSQTVDPPRPHRYVGRWYEEPQGFELSIVSLDGGPAVGFIFPKSLLEGDLMRQMPAGINHWYWRVFYKLPTQSSSGGDGPVSTLPATPSTTPTRRSDDTSGMTPTRQRLTPPTPTGIPPGYGE
jgi:hypothetical protein